MSDTVLVRLPRSIVQLAGEIARVRTCQGKFTTIGEVIEEVAIDDLIWCHHQEIGRLGHAEKQAFFARGSRGLARKAEPAQAAPRKSGRAKPAKKR